MSMNGMVSERVRLIFVETLNIQVPSDETDLIDGGLLDSLALVELLVEIEELFGVSIAVDGLDIDDFRTVRSITRVIDQSAGAA
jgi:methoxymalonate biosynthesis acyl carrier protein